MIVEEVKESGVVINGIDTVGKAKRVDKMSKKSRKKKKLVKEELESEMGGNTKNDAKEENTVENVKEESTPNMLTSKTNFTDFFPLASMGGVLVKHKGSASSCSNGGEER